MAEYLRGRRKDNAPQARTSVRRDFIMPDKKPKFDTEGRGLAIAILLSLQGALWLGIGVAVGWATWA